MRVTNKMMFEQSNIYINRQYEQLYLINEKVSSGKRVNRPSDDPIGSGKILGYRSLVSSLEQYEKNIETGATWLSYTESALSNAEQVFMDAKVLAEQLATGTQRSDLHGHAPLLAENRSSLHPAAGRRHVGTSGDSESEIGPPCRWRKLGRMTIMKVKFPARLSRLCQPRYQELR